MARRTLTHDVISDLKPKAERFSVSDPELPGHYVRVTPNGAKTFVAMARDPNKKQVMHTIGTTKLYRIGVARIGTRCHKGHQGGAG